MNNEYQKFYFLIILHQKKIYIRLSPGPFAFCIIWVVYDFGEIASPGKRTFSLIIGSVCPPSVQEITKELRNFCALFKPIQIVLSLTLTQLKFYPEYWYI